MTTTKIGWIGLGNMGIPMVQQLIKAGYPVTVYNRSKAKEESLVAMGAATATSPAALSHDSELIFIIVSDDDAVRQIIAGQDGVLSAGATGKIVINMSSVSPGISREMAVLLQQQGHHYLDAPVSGSVKQAETGQLVIMAGGEQAVFDQVKPVLEYLGKLTVKVGPTGAGNSAKLAINTLLAIHAQGLAEAVVFARQQGIATDDLLTLIDNSALGNVFARIKGEAIRNNNYQAAFALKHIVKDLNLAKAEGLASPLADTALHTFTAAGPALGEEDIIAVIKQLDPGTKR